MFDYYQDLSNKTHAAVSGGFGVVSAFLSNEIEPDAVELFTTSGGEQVYATDPAIVGTTSAAVAYGLHKYAERKNLEES